MHLYYDRVSKMFTLDTEEDVEFLGPITNALVVLRHKFELTPSQAREATLQAFFNGGDAVCLDDVKRIS